MMFTLSPTFFHHSDLDEFIALMVKHSKKVKSKGEILHVWWDLLISEELQSVCDESELTEFSLQGIRSEICQFITYIQVR